MINTEDFIFRSGCVIPIPTVGKNYQYLEGTYTCSRISVEGIEEQCGEEVIELFALFRRVKKAKDGETD